MNRKRPQRESAAVAEIYVSTDGESERTSSYVPKAAWAEWSFRSLSTARGA